MIDIERRRKLALHLRHLSIGLISNDTFESNMMDDVTKGWLPEQYYRDKGIKSDDLIIAPMAKLSWSTYSDLKNHKLTGSYQLPKESLKIVARCILFLHSDKEYEWSYFDTNSPVYRFSFRDYILSILTLGYHFRLKRSEQEQLYTAYQKSGDFDYWPFFKKDDYIAQLKNQPFLNFKNSPSTFED
jgi:hypothetical protein